VFSLVIAFPSAVVLLVEPAPGNNVRPTEDAVWWSVATITTVGYGDRYPVIGEGLPWAMAPMFCVVALFGALRGIVASLFLCRVKEEEDEILVATRPLRAEIAATRSAQKPTPASPLTPRQPRIAIPTFA